jgi:hypothetical protein
MCQVRTFLLFGLMSRKVVHGTKQNERLGLEPRR